MVGSGGAVAPGRERDAAARWARGQAGVRLLAGTRPQLLLLGDELLDQLPGGGASVGDVPVGAVGAQWKAFKSLALPDGLGPVFAATMLAGVGGVDATNDLGLWGQDRDGVLRLLLREGDVIGGNVVKKFAVLKSVSGSPDQTRSFNRNLQLILRATFVDGTQVVIRIDMP